MCKKLVLLQKCLVSQFSVEKKCLRSLTVTYTHGKTCFYFTFRRIDISPSTLRKHTRLAGEERVFKEEGQKVGSE